MTAPLVALLVFLALQLGIGIYISKRIANEADYLIGGRRLGRRVRHCGRRRWTAAEPIEAAIVEQWVSLTNTTIDPVFMRQYVVPGYAFPATPDKSPEVSRVRAM